MNFLRVYFLFFILITQGYAFIDPDTTKRFEYKLSFKGPNLVFKDGTVPFWEHSGSTICTNDQIRITPSIRSQKGRIWSKATMSSDNWEIEVTMRVNGRGRVGADGMAIWYTETIGTEGPVFGSNDHWKGLGIFLDSFDNDAQQNNPYILIMTNDGTKSYDHNRDGITQQLGGCLRDFRNKPFPIGLKIEYNKRVLTVYYHNGLSENDNQYQEICARVENVDLPKNGHFGISAATGGLADDHDVLTFNTFSLIHNQNNQPQVPNPEQLKYDQEYQEFLKQLELEKASYKKAHPEEQEQVIDARQNFESEYDRQFRTILDIQHSIHSKLHSLDSKFAEVLGRQERIVSLLTNQAVQMPGSGSNNNNNNNNQPGVPVDTFNRMEVNQVMSQQNELVRSLRDLQNSVIDVQQKANYISNTVRTQGQPGQPTYQDKENQVQPGQVQRIIDDVANFRHEMNMLVRQNKQSCPEVSCVSTLYFMIIIFLQSILFLVYFIYKSRSEAQQKKFY